MGGGGSLVFSMFDVQADCISRLFSEMPALFGQQPTAGRGGHREGALGRGRGHSLCKGLWLP